MGLRDRIHDMRAMGPLFAAAKREADRTGDELPGAEHLLVAAVAADDDESGRRALARVGLDVAAVRQAIADQHAEALRSMGVVVGSHPDEPRSARPRTGPVRTSGAAQTMFRAVVDRVRRERSRLLGAWFVLVAAETRHGTVARVVDQLAVEPAALAAAARAEIDADAR